MTPSTFVANESYSSMSNWILWKGRLLVGQQRRNSPRYEDRHDRICKLYDELLKREAAA